MSRHLVVTAMSFTAFSAVALTTVAQAQSLPSGAFEVAQARREMIRQPRATTKKRGRKGAERRRRSAKAAAAEIKAPRRRSQSRRPSKQAHRAKDKDRRRRRTPRTP